MTPRTSPRARRRAPKMGWLVAVCLPWLGGVAAAAELTITLEGLSGDLKKAIEGSLTLHNYANRDVTPAQIRRLFNNTEQEIRAALEPYGYYNATVASTLQTNEDGRLHALFQITTGEPVKVRSKKVTVEGEATELRRVQRAVSRFKPGEGEVFDHGLYEASKSDIETALTDSGFLKMQATRRRVEVSRQANTADIDVNWVSGPRMKFGRVNFSQSQFPPEFLDRYIPWEEGAYYSPEELLALQQRLVDADYFATVTAQPDLDNAQGVEVPINVELTPANRTIYSAGLYGSTDVGAGVRLGLQRRWINRKGHKFQADLDYAQRLSALSARYRIPLPGPNEKSLNFGLTHRDENTVTSQSRNNRAAINETRRWRGFTRTVGLQYFAGDFEVAEEKRFSHLLYGEMTLTKKEANNFFFPRRGWSLGTALRFSPEGPLSDTSFSQLTLDGKYIMPLGRRQRFISRLNLGAMSVDDFDQLPPDLRFFAGGDLSIRGFDYQELGTTNASGLVIGGEFLAVASLEVEHYFLQNWGAAVFVDGGDAFRAGEFDVNIGAGLGVRWRSPVGVVRLDVAKPVSSDLADTIRFHITIGPDL